MKRTRFEKTLRITSDLMLYCHNHGATEINTDITENDGKNYYTVSGYPVHISDKQLQDLIKRLSAPRQKEVEQEYWELMGESENFAELTLVGMLCDEEQVVYENRKLTFTLTRYD